MQLHGSLIVNLEAALQSARRLRGKPIYADTLAHWADLIAHARTALPTEPHPEPIERLIGWLEAELADRATPDGTG